jgi:hypothetical protein
VNIGVKVCCTRPWFEEHCNLVRPSKRPLNNASVLVETMEIHSRSSLGSCHPPTPADTLAGMDILQAEGLATRTPKSSSLIGIVVTGIQVAVCFKQPHELSMWLATSSML